MGFLVVPEYVVWELHYICNLTVNCNLASCLHISVTQWVDGYLRHYNSETEELTHLGFSRDLALIEASIAFLHILYHQVPGFLHSRIVTLKPLIPDESIAVHC